MSISFHLSTSLSFYLSGEDQQGPQHQGAKRGDRSPRRANQQVKLIYKVVRKKHG